MLSSIGLGSLGCRRGGSSRLCAVGLGRGADGGGPLGDIGRGSRRAAGVAVAGGRADMSRGDVRLRRVVGITAVVGVVSGGTLWVVVVISVPYPFIIMNMMRVPATLCPRLGKQHIGAPRSLEYLVLVGFSKRSCSPDIGVRESAVVPGRK